MLLNHHCFVPYTQIFPTNTGNLKLILITRVWLASKARELPGDLNGRTSHSRSQFKRRDEPDSSVSGSNLSLSFVWSVRYLVHLATRAISTSHRLAKRHEMHISTMSSILLSTDLRPCSSFRSSELILHAIPFRLPR